MSAARANRRHKHVGSGSGLVAHLSISTGSPRHRRSTPAPLWLLLVGLSAGSLLLLGGLDTTAAGPASGDGNVAAAASPVTASVKEQRDRQRLVERASRSRRVQAVDPEPAPTALRAPAVPAQAPAPLLPGCSGKAPAGSAGRNGRLPGDVLCAVPGGSGEVLRADAAVAFVRLIAAYEVGLGERVCVTDGYRTLGEQQQLRRIKPRFAARPGYSQHGWGLAVDLSCGVQSFDSRQHRWMVDNAERYGWVLPAWAQRDGARPEPWHWEYAGA